MIVEPLHFVSYSSLNTFHSCPRKFELDRMGPEGPEIENINFVYGHALGAGVAELFDSGDLQKAFFKAFLAWTMPLDETLNLDKPGSALTDKAKNSFPWVIEALKQFYGHYLVLSQEWELFYYETETGEKKPATELSARIELPGGYYYRLYIDVVLRNKATEELLVFELKSDGSKVKLPAKYANSNQVLGYSTILDKIQPGATSFMVWYAVFYKQLEEWEFYQFSKSRLAKANWIRTILYDTNNIETCRREGFFPKQGESCIDFYRPCYYFENGCDGSNRATYAPEILRVQRVEKEQKTEYTYRFTLSEIVEQQLEDVRT